MTDGVDGCIADDVGFVKDGSSCGDDNGDTSQEQQGARGLVHCGAELLNIVLEAAHQEAAACKACISKRLYCAVKCMPELIHQFCRLRKPRCQ